MTNFDMPTKSQNVLLASSFQKDGPTFYDRTECRSDFLNVVLFQKSVFPFLDFCGLILR